MDLATVLVQRGVLESIGLIIAAFLILLTRKDD